METWVFALVLVLFGNSHAQTFGPGCSFSNGQCIYNVKLGHEKHCDAAGKRDTASTPSSGFQSCSCKDIDAVSHNVDALYTTMATLQQNFNSLATKLNVTQVQLGMKTNEVNSLFSANHNLTAMLAAKESLLKKSKVELANTVASMNRDLDNLRKQLTNKNNQLTVCQAGVTPGSKQPTDPVLYSNYVTHFCDFESNSYCNYQLGTCTGSSTECWTHGTGRQNTQSGPIEDHTFGTPHGHYMYIDPNRHAYYTSSGHSNLRLARITSPEFQPGSHYCLRFWYTMYGINIKTLKVYARVGSGDGYPIFQLSGQKDKYWHMAEVPLTSEYTANPFKIVLEGSTDSYYSFDHHSSSKQYHDTAGYIAFDDVFVYNTSCSAIPTCPANSHKHTFGNETSCYTFHVTPKNWYDAVNTCKMEAPNGHLVSVNSKKEQEFLVDTLQNDAAFVAAGSQGWFTSGNDERTESSYMWTDTGYPYPVNFTDWTPGQPNNVGNVQDCLLLENQQADYTWGDVNCADKHPFICEIKL